jgi:DNA polymerase-3 subunit epsilon
MYKVKFDKKVWLDLETTGLSANKHGVIELALMVEVNHKIVDKLCVVMKPFKGCEYTDEALEINKKTKKQIKKFPKEKDVVREIVDFLDNNRVSYQPLAGYNVQFDIRFLKALFKRNGIFYTDYFNYYDIDIYGFVKFIQLPTKNKKLGTVCEHFEIDLSDAHNALDDIEATYKLYKKINVRYLSNI